MQLPFLNARAITLALLLSLVATIWFGAVSSAHAQKSSRPAGHLSDPSELVDSATRSRLENVLEKLKERTDIDVVVAIIKSAGSEELYDVSLRMANDWNVGAMASPTKSLLVLITADNGKFFTQISRSARTILPDGLIGDMGLRMRTRLENGALSQGLLLGIQTFVNGVGEAKNFSFADLDTRSETSIAQQSRPRMVSTPLAEATESPSPQPTPVTTPEVVPLPSATATPTPLVETATPTPAVEATITPATPTPTEAVPSPSPSSTPEQSPPAAIVAPTPESSPASTPKAEPTIRVDTTRTNRTGTPDRKASPTPTPDPEDEKEEVELTLTKPASQRIDLLKAFIANHPQSVAVARANELIVATHATLGDQKLQAGDTQAGLQEFRLAFSEAPAEMSDKLFTEVLARIPMNLFLRGQREAALGAAHQAEALAKLNPLRLLALVEFYMTIENADEANRLAELVVANAPDSAEAHQALGAARHIALRLDDAETEYARTLALDSKSRVARIALADLKRAGGKFDDALALYREQLQIDPASKAARAGVVISLLELGKKEQADQELSNALADKDQGRNLSLLVGAAYWFVAHNQPERGLDLAQKAVDVEPRYSWAQIALARSLLASGRPLEAERALRFARQYSHFPTLDYELANVLVSVGLFDEAAQELMRSFSIKDGQIETRLAGRTPAKSTNFIELLAPERRAAIFQPVAADTEVNAKIIKGLLVFITALSKPSLSSDDALASAQNFGSGDDPMHTYRQIYIAQRFLRANVALSSVGDLMEKASTGVEIALSVPAATVAVQPEELSDIRAQALAQGGTPDVPVAPRSALSGILRARIEDLAGLALFNLERSEEAVAPLRRAVSVAPPGTPLSRTSMWHLASALEATGKSDQALLYYIKSYLAGPPDPARRAIIETVYKKVNGSLEGLDDKIGAGFATANAGSTPSPGPSPTPTPQI